MELDGCQMWFREFISHSSPPLLSTNLRLYSIGRIIFSSASLLADKSLNYNFGGLREVVECMRRW